MHIQRMIEILNAPSLLTEAELNELACKVDELISKGFVDIAALILEKISADKIFTSHSQQISVLLLAIERGYINLLLVLHKKGYRLAQPDVIYNGGPYDHRLYVAICNLIRSGMFHDKPIGDFINALELIQKLCAPGLFEIKQFTQFALSNYGSLYNNPSQYYPYFDVLLNKENDMDILKTEYRIYCSSDRSFSIDIECNPAFFSYLIPKIRPISEQDILRSMTPHKTDSKVIKALLQEVRAHYRDGKVYFSNGHIEIKKIIDLLLKAAKTDWNGDCIVTAVFDALALTIVDIRTILVDHGIPETELEYWITRVSKTREEHDEYTQHKRIRKMIENKDVAALSAIPAEQLLVFKKYGFISQLSNLIDDYSSNPVFLLLAFFKMDFLTMLCETNQIALIKALPEKVIPVLGLEKWLFERVVSEQQHDLLEIWSSLFPGVKRLVEYKNAYDELLHEIRVEAVNKGVPFNEAFALSFLSLNDVENNLDKMVHLIPDFKRAYLALHPIIRFACVVEDNSNFAQLFAQRLALLFRCKDRAITYLSQHHSQFPELIKPVHDACVLIRFSKEIAIWNVSVWSDLLLRLGSKAAKFLPWAPIIENKMTFDGKAVYILKQEQFDTLQLSQGAELEKKHTEAVLNQTQGNANVDPKKIAITIQKNILRALTALTYKEIERVVSARLSIKNATFSTLPKSEKKNQIKQYIRCHDLSQMNMDDLNFLIEHPYWRAAEHISFAKDCISIGMTELNFNRCLDLMKIDRQNVSVPELIIDGQVLGYPNFYLRKLAPNDPLGFILGEKTQCCQSIGSDGEKCAIHGMTSEFGGFYVLFKKGNQSDKVIAQTWAWISQKGNLVFDSIENVKRFDQKMISDFYQAAAVKLLQHHKHIDQVVVGMGGNTPALISGVSIESTVDFEQPKDYDAYRDSKSKQNILASQKDLTLKLDNPQWAIEKLKLCGDLGQKIICEIEFLERGTKSQWPIWGDNANKLSSIVLAINQLPDETVNELDVAHALHDDTSPLCRALQVELPKTRDGYSLDADLIEQLFSVISELVHFDHKSPVQTA